MISHSKSDSLKYGDVRIGNDYGQHLLIWFLVNALIVFDASGISTYIMLWWLFESIWFNIFLLYPTLSRLFCFQEFVYY